MDDFKCGIRFGNFTSVKLRPSYKDLLLLFGIAVAVIVALTTIFVNDEPGKPKTTERKEVPKTGFNLSPASLLKRTVERVEWKGLLPEEKLFMN